MPNVFKYLLICCIFAAAQARAADDLDPGDAVAGRAYALQACSDCHNIAARRNRLLSILSAPDFYAVANAKTTTAIGLSVFLQSQHRSMPSFIIGDEDRRNVIAHIMSLREQR
jgi:mono/diheme cytochrome c family protein